MVMIASAYKPVSAEARYWSKVNKNGPVPEQRPELGSCWLWCGKTNDSGYGIFSIKSTLYRAHRIAWQMHHGREVPDGHLVRHMCDVRSCVNPAHLVAGDHSDNTADTVRRKRIHKAMGSAVPSAKLTEDKVQWAREQWDSGLATKAELARKLGVSSTTMDAVVTRKSWKHLK